MATPLSRREVLKFGAYTTVGGVLTPGISLAQAVVTDTMCITARDIQLNVGGTMIPAYDARPEKLGRYPIVVAISGFTGNSEHHKDVVRRFAHAGYYAISAELYHREGGMQGKNLTNPNVEFVLYPGVPHGFFSDDRPQVDKKEASEDAWKRCLVFFDKRLKA